MSTAPAHRRQGYGGVVVDALPGWFAEAGVRRVDLRTTPDGRGLYERAGFREVGGAALSWTSRP